MEDKIEVPKQALLDVVRKIDFDAPMSIRDFGNSFDKLRTAFTKDELLSGKALKSNFKCLHCSNKPQEGDDICRLCYAKGNIPPVSELMMKY